MTMLSDQVKEQLRERFAERLTGAVELKAFTRPGSGRLILPGGMGCPTCEEARQLAEEIEQAAPDLISLEVVDVTAGGGPAVDVPTLTVSGPGSEARIAFQGLTGGYEFATVVDAIERVSAGESGLSEASLELLRALDDREDGVEVMVFATPT